MTVEELKKPSADAGSYLKIAPGCEEVEKGSASNITVYGRAVELPMPGSAVADDLQYWVFYALRGASTGRFGNALYNTVPFFLTPCGRHQGDWKVIKVRIDNTGAMLGVFFSAHTWGTWYAASAIGQPDGFQVTSAGAPLVYDACYSHSCFAQPNRTIVEATQVLLPPGVLRIDIIEQDREGRQRSIDGCGLHRSGLAGVPRELGAEGVTETRHPRPAGGYFQRAAGNTVARAADTTFGWYRRDGPDHCRDIR